MSSHFNVVSEVRAAHNYFLDVIDCAKNRHVHCSQIGSRPRCRVDVCTRFDECRKCQRERGITVREKIGHSLTGQSWVQEDTTNEV